MKTIHILRILIDENNTYANIYLSYKKKKTIHILRILINSFEKLYIKRINRIALLHIDI